MGEVTERQRGAELALANLTECVEQWLRAPREPSNIVEVRARVSDLRSAMVGLKRIQKNAEQQRAVARVEELAERILQQLDLHSAV